MWALRAWAPAEAACGVRGPMARRSRPRGGRSLPGASAGWVGNDGPGPGELADLLLDARPLAISEAIVALERARRGQGLAALRATAEGAAHEVFLSAIKARQAALGPPQDYWSL
jgi:hypothetical protein